MGKFVNDGPPAMYMKSVVTGPSGSGKTRGCLLTAAGMCNGDWKKVFLIDAEGRGNLFRHLGPYQLYDMDGVHTPEAFINAVKECIEAGAGAIVVDTLSHPWNRMVEEHAAMPGNSFANWGKVKGRNKKMIHYMLLEADVHLFGILRVKTKHEASEDGEGKSRVKKLGAMPIQEEQIEYEFTLGLQMDMDHMATVFKKPEMLFPDAMPMFLEEEIGKEIINFCAGYGNSIETVQQLINSAKTDEELTGIWKQFKPLYCYLEPEFKARKAQLKKK